MILSGIDIHNEISKGNITINPFNPEQMNANSYNLRLHNEILVYTKDDLDMAEDNKTTKVLMLETGLMLYPNTLYLGRTVEQTITHGFVPMLEGRSSVGRLGMFIHVTAGFGDVGFSGFWTLEIVVVQPLRVYPNTEIAQIYYHTVSEVHTEYSSDKYQFNTGIQASKLFTEF